MYVYLILSNIGNKPLFQWRQYASQPLRTSFAAKPKGCSACSVPRAIKHSSKVVPKNDKILDTDWYRRGFVRGTGSLHFHRHDAGFWSDFTASRMIMGAAGTVSVCDAGFWNEFTASRTILAASGIFSVTDAGFWSDFTASRMIVAADRDARKDNRGWLSVNKTFSHPLNTIPLPVAILNKKCLPPADDKHLMNIGLKKILLLYFT